MDGVGSGLKTPVSPPVDLSTSSWVPPTASVFPWLSPFLASWRIVWSLGSTVGQAFLVDNAASMGGVEPCCDDPRSGLGASPSCVLVSSPGDLATAKELVLLPVLMGVFGAVLVDMSVADTGSRHSALPAA